MYFERLVELRNNSYKTQQEIAEVLQCQREVYRRYEKDVHEIPAWALIKLAKFYNVSIDYIVGLTNEKKPYGRI